MTLFKNRPILSWCLYDWANSVLATIIFTFVFSVYFSRGIVGDEVLGSAYWGYAIGIAGGIVALTGPILGAISDAFGPRKPLLLGLTILTILSTIAMFWAMPDPSYTLYALIFVGIATIGFELAQSQYNAMLSDIAPADKIGRISGWAWSLGYFGGLVCLIIALVAFIGSGDGTGLLGLSEENSLNVRATCILAAIWYLVFALPLFLYVPDRKKIPHQKGLIVEAFQSLWQTIKSLFTTSGNVGRFLIASAIYRDGLNTLFTVGGLYAAGTFGMDFQEILIFAIGLNITSGIGAFAFAYFDDAKGAKPTIVISLIALIGLGVGIMIVEDKNTFLILALALGLFIGPVQASSRSMMARLAPKDASTEMFGIYAMTGKSIAFTGPLLFAFLTQITDSQRWGIGAIIGLWMIGLVLLMRVKETTTP
jgi:UMF1 family MFS transporter